MKQSIRKFLLINLLLCVALMTALTTLGNLVLNDKELQQQLDTELLQDNLALQAITDTNDLKNRFSKLHKNIAEIPALVKSSPYFMHADGKHKSRYLTDPVEFQIWSSEGELLVRSPNAPLIDISPTQEGFANVTIGSETWRSFTTINPKTGNKVIFAERYTIRDLLSKRLMRNDLLILLITYPLFGLLIWVIVGRGFRSLERVTEEVAHRESNFLKPVDLSEVPSEISPLVVELNKLFLRLGDTIEREKRFSGDAAHELRTPLAALRTQVQVALKMNDPHKLKASLKKIIKAVDRSSHVVQQLLTLSRMTPEAEDHTQKKRINLACIASENIADLAPIAYEKHIEIELVTDQQAVYIHGNATSLHILFRNLIDNAIRYTPEKSYIKVKIVKTEQHAVIQVIDNGPGIPAELRTRVFERFYRVIGNKSPGSGLGLAIVQQIAQLHKGSISLDAPEVGSGLIVTIKFPTTKVQPPDNRNA